MMNSFSSSSSVQPKLVRYTKIESYENPCIGILDIRCRQATDKSTNGGMTASILLIFSILAYKLKISRHCACFNCYAQLDFVGPYTYYNIRLHEDLTFF